MRRGLRGCFRKWSWRLKAPVREGRINSREYVATTTAVGGPQSASNSGPSWTSHNRMPVSACALTAVAPTMGHSRTNPYWLSRCQFLPLDSRTQFEQCLLLRSGSRVSRAEVARFDVSKTAYCTSSIFKGSIGGPFAINLAAHPLSISAKDGSPADPTKLRPDRCEFTERLTEADPGRTWEYDDASTGLHLARPRAVRCGGGGQHHRYYHTQLFALIGRRVKSVKSHERSQSLLGKP